MIRRTACLIARDNDPFRNLAIEKHLMDTLPDSTAILFLYQNRQSFVMGRNQNPRFEFQVDDFLKAGGVITRRLSGGTTCYQDMGTLNFSIILPKREFDAARQLRLLAEVAACFGIRTESAAGGMLRCGGKVFCQNTFYKSGSVALHQGSLHVAADFDSITDFLCKEQPLASAVPQMMNLQEAAPGLTVSDVEQCLFRGFSAFFRSEPTWLDEQIMDQNSLNTYAGQFAAEEWIYPPKMEHDFSVSERFPWGSVSVLLRREGGIIREAKIFSDAMEAALFFPIEQGLVGCPFLIGAINTRFTQRLEMVSDPRLLQIAGDVCTLICGRIRAQDRAGHPEE